jgi:hypothetical protein
MDYSPAPGKCIECMADVSDSLRPQTTRCWNKDWTERSYGFPINPEMMRVHDVDWRPVDSYSLDQNTRFEQRYFVK